jgi:hypothetical protein
MTERQILIPNELLARRCESLMQGAKKLYDSGPNQGDMWFFELYHHLDDCAAALRRANGENGSKTDA